MSIAILRVERGIQEIYSNFTGDSINTRGNNTYKLKISAKFLVLRMAIINVESRPNSHL